MSAELRELMTSCKENPLHAQELKALHSKRNQRASQLPPPTSHSGFSVFVNYTNHSNKFIIDKLVPLQSCRSLWQSSSHLRSIRIPGRPNEFVMLEDTATKIKRRTSFVLSESEHKRLRIFPPPISGDINTDQYLQRVAQLPNFSL